MIFNLLMIFNLEKKNQNKVNLLVLMINNINLYVLMINKLISLVNKVKIIYKKIL